MALLTNKRSIMNLISDPLDPYCHQVRIVMAEKAVTVEIVEVNPEEVLDSLAEYNPDCSLPTLVDRELSIYTAPIIMEYLDERFPHPPLLPVYPVARAEARRHMYRIEKDLYSLVHILRHETDAEKLALTRKKLADALTSLAPIFAEKPFFLSDEFSLIDCTLAPLLWRLPSYGITLPNQAKSIEKYSERIFKRDAFQASLSELENELQ